MLQNALRTFALLLFVSLPALGKEKVMVCKYTDSVCSDDNIEKTGSDTAIDHSKVSKIIDEKISQGLEEMNSKFEMMQKNITELLQGQRCREENGLPFSGKCYIVPHISSSQVLPYNDAIQTCANLGALVAEVNSMAQQQALQDFFRPRVPSSRQNSNLWVAMVYESSRRTLRFRSGKEVSIEHFKWHRGYPMTSDVGVGVQISVHGRLDIYKWLFNKPLSYLCHGVICEKNL